MRTALAVAALLALAACDYVDKPLGAEDGPDTPPPAGVPRRILLEEYTGHECTFCPDGHEIAEGLKQEYGDGLVIIAMHVGDLAVPRPPGSDKYTTEFRTPDGDAIFQRWNTSSIPKALINRLPYNSTMLPGRNAWSPAVFAQAGLTADVDLWFENLSASGGTVSGTLKAAVLNNLAGNYQLVLALTEDSIVDWQLVNGAEPPDQPGYTHRHALRGNLNGAWGQALVNGSANAGDTLSLPFNQPMPANVLNPAKTYLVAYLANSTTDEVIQTVERKIAN